MNQSTRIVILLLAVAGLGRISLAQNALKTRQPGGPVIDNPRVTSDRWPSNYDARSWIHEVWRLEGAGPASKKR